MVAPAQSADPVQVDVEGDPSIARWRPLVHWLLVIPHAVVLNVLGIVQGVLTAVAFFTVLFTTRIPPGVFDTIVMVHRYQWRVNTYVYCFRESYAPFDFTASADDPGTDPARLAIARPERLNRWLPLVKWLLAVPHYVVLIFVSLGAFFAVLIGWVGVLVRGTYPPGIKDFLVGYQRWTVRVAAYVGLLTDRYPPFSLD
ncbi:MAG TPA: DUF4389 domain-containing protein [Acidimicrobiales bacterium]